MGGIVGGIERVAGIMSDIVASSREQSGSIAQVGQSVTQMDQATQQNATLVKEAAANRQGPAGTGGPARRLRQRLLRTVI
ncbi:hypothetical protein [Massilia pinisoli]|uniref:hypothetical protein n=1 Tax=Massilia pinisoli TaxID=1772194 RepID=UPI00351D856C